MSAKIAANGIQTHASTNQRRVLELWSQKFLNAGQI